jgi:hypothetical protein
MNIGSKPAFRQMKGADPIRLLVFSLLDSLILAQILSSLNFASRFRLSTGLPSDSQNATLSYVWGTHKILKLEETNVDTFLQRIPVNKLCNTF